MMFGGENDFDDVEAPAKPSADLKALLIYGGMHVVLIAVAFWVGLTF